MKIGFFEIEGWEKEIILNSNLAKDNEIIFQEDSISEINIPKEKDFDIISIFVNSRLNKSALVNFPNLKLICTRSTGFDHIELNACKERGIKVAYVPGYGDNTVAEFTFGLILNLTRKIYQAIDQIKEFESFSLKDLRGIDLKGKTLGVIGTGRIGKEVIKIAKGFSMNILAFDPFPDNAFASAYNINYTTLEDLLKNSQIVSIHCPYTSSTHHLINKNNIRLFQKGSYLINTARGGIVETAAVVFGLNEKILAGYATDVLEAETEIKNEINYVANEFLKRDELKTILYNHILMKMPNVLITPHNAFNTFEALQRILNTTIENIKYFLDNKPLNLLN